METPYNVDAKQGWRTPESTSRCSSAPVEKVSVKYKGGQWTADPRRGCMTRMAIRSVAFARADYVLPGAREGGLIGKVGAAWGSVLYRPRCR